MRIVTLTHAEAADPAVLANLMQHLAEDAAVVVRQPPRAIAHADRPDVGIDLSPQSDIEKAARVFGGAAVPVIPPVPGAATSTAVVAALPIAPAVPPASLPLPPSASPAPAPVPVSAAAAPMAPVVPASPASVVVDAAGLPWDHRIHSRTKAKNQNGTWRQKRETPPELVQQVEAELRALMALPAPAGAAAAPAMPVPPVPTPPVTPTVPATGVPVPPTTTAASPVAAPAPAPAATTSSFADFMQWLTPYMTTNIITHDHLTAALVKHGMKGLPDLIHRPEFVSAVRAEVEPLVPKQ